MHSCAIVDAGPLIALARLDRLHLPDALFDEVIVAPAAMTESLRPYPRPEHHRLLHIERRRHPGAVDTGALLGQSLGPGEAESIALAVMRPGATLVLDDRKARLVATRVFGLMVLGTAGLLVAAKRRGLIEAVRPRLEALDASGYFLGRELIEMIAASIGE
jgi:predicted nucleic acid-binding protein